MLSPHRVLAYTRWQSSGAFTSQRTNAELVTKACCKRFLVAYGRKTPCFDAAHEIL